MNPLWASINNGVFVCLSCSGLHRSLGVQMSQVRSLTLDSWTERQLKSMSLGGNKNLREFFKAYDLNEESVQTKYKSKASAYYRSKVIDSEKIIISCSCVAWLRESPLKNLRSPLTTRVVNLSQSRVIARQARSPTTTQPSNTT